MAKYQAFLFFPLLLLEGFSLHVSSVKALLRKDLRRAADGGGPADRRTSPPT